MEERRVVFDFSIEFVNGGGVQGQGFRLDIEGPDISDDELAILIVQDLRLLMVESVRITNKHIVSEPHRRRALKAAGGDGVRSEKGQQTHIDLSHVIENGMVTYKGLPAPVISDHLSFEASHWFYSAGTEFSISRIDMVANTGTYLDTPYHRYPSGNDLSQQDLTRLADIPGTVIRTRGSGERAIDWKIFLPYDLKGRAVLVETGWDRHWGSDEYFDGHPFLTEQAAIYLRDRGAALVGIDSPNIDDTGAGTRPVHSVLLEAGIPIVEHLTGLDNLPDENFRFSAVPPKIKGMGTFPVRAYASCVE